MKKSKVNKINNKKLFVGEFIGNERGFGFIKVNDEEEDFFVAHNHIKSAMNGDRVSFKIIVPKEDGRRAEAKVVDILERKTKFIVGTYTKSKNFGFVIPDDKRLMEDIYIPKKLGFKAKTNDKVVVEIIKYPLNNKSPEGKVIEILGNKDSSEVDLLTVLKMFDYKCDFPKEVHREAKFIPQVVNSFDGRVDLRDREIFTIDGDDTKDIDDAVSLCMKDGNYFLGVHIADVSSYVKEGSHLDKEAARRGTSVYLIDTVIPMLPKELSNGICSLNPNVDRYALTVDMQIDKNGNVLNTKIYKSVIRSRIQMTYNNVYNVLENNIIAPGYEPFVNTLKLMKELAEIFISKREKDGAIDFNLPEAKIILDDEKKVKEIRKREITIANKIIEQFMIVTNERVAETFLKKEIPFIYRVHEKPDEDKIQRLNVFLNNINYTTKTLEEVNSRYLKDVIDYYRGKPEEKVVLNMLLRTMKLARYSNENIGHFGLMLKYYCHFTSPIRRYPDLFIHRVISEFLNGGLDVKKKAKFLKLSAKYSDMSSENERTAEEAERTLEEIKKAEYMSQFIGDEFEGVVSSLTPFGVFVELDNTVEGLVHVENMKDDYYIFDEENVQFIGEHKHKVYKIGDVVKVRVIATDKILRRVDFEMV